MAVTGLHQNATGMQALARGGRVRRRSRGRKLPKSSKPRPELEPQEQEPREPQELEQQTRAPTGYKPNVPEVAEAAAAPPELPMDVGGGGAMIAPEQEAAMAPSEDELTGYAEGGTVADVEAGQDRLALNAARGSMTEPPSTWRPRPIRVPLKKGVAAPPGVRGYQEGGEVDDDYSSGYSSDYDQTEPRRRHEDDEPQYLRDPANQARADATDLPWIARPDSPAWDTLNAQTSAMAEAHEPSENVEDRRDQAPYEPSLLDRAAQPFKNIYQNAKDELGLQVSDTGYDRAGLAQQQDTDRNYVMDGLNWLRNNFNLGGVTEALGFGDRGPASARGPAPEAQPRIGLTPLPAETPPSGRQGGVDTGYLTPATTAIKGFMGFGADQRPAAQPQQLGMGYSGAPAEPDVTAGAGGAGRPSGIEAYLQGHGAIDADRLGTILDNVAQNNPDLDHNGLRYKAVVDAARLGDNETVGGLLQNFRTSYDEMIGRARGAEGHGDLAGAVRLATEAHNHVPDNRSIDYAVMPNGNVSATARNADGTGVPQRFTMTPDQFRNYLEGVGTSFDHVIENGAERNLQIATGAARPAAAETTGVGGTTAGPMVQHPLSRQADQIPAGVVPTGYAAAGQQAAAAPAGTAQAPAGAANVPYHYTPETEYQRLINKDTDLTGRLLTPEERTRVAELRKLESVPGYRAPGTPGIPGEEYNEQGQRLMPKSWRDEQDRLINEAYASPIGQKALAAAGGNRSNYGAQAGYLQSQQAVDDARKAGTLVQGPGGNLYDKGTGWLVGPQRGPVDLQYDARRGASGGQPTPRAAATAAAGDRLIRPEHAQRDRPYGIEKPSSTQQARTDVAAERADARRVAAREADMPQIPGLRIADGRYWDRGGREVKISPQEAREIAGGQRTVTQTEAPSRKFPLGRSTVIAGGEAPRDGRPLTPEQVASRSDPGIKFAPASSYLRPDGSVNTDLRANGAPPVNAPSGYHWVPGETGQSWRLSPSDRSEGFKTVRMFTDRGPVDVVMPGGHDPNKMEYLNRETTSATGSVRVYPNPPAGNEDWRTAQNVPQATWSSMHPTPGGSAAADQQIVHPRQAGRESETMNPAYRGVTVAPPPASDMSPAAQALRAFPGAGDYDKRKALENQLTLEQQRAGGRMDLETIRQKSLDDRQLTQIAANAQRDAIKASGISDKIAPSFMAGIRDKLKSGEELNPVEREVYDRYSQHVLDQLRRTTPDYTPQQQQAKPAEQPGFIQRTLDYLFNAPQQQQQTGGALPPGVPQGAQLMHSPSTGQVFYKHGDALYDQTGRRVR